jgi:hypothetical protein
MPGYLGALSVVLLLAMVLSRVWLLKQQGVAAMKFGQTDKTDFLIPPVFLPCVCRSIRLAIRRQAAIILFRLGRVGWRGGVRGGAGVAAVEFDLVQAELPHRHRHGSPRYADHVRHLCFQP